MFEGPGRALTRAAAANAMGVPALWVGPAFDGLPLARVATTREGIARNREPASGWNIVNGLLLYYGDADDPCARVAFPSGRCAGKGAFVAVREQPRLLFAFQYFPPEGQLLLEEGPTGLLRRDGVYVTIDAPSEGLVLAAARALEPMSRG
jgi:hypothetical protein